MQVLKVIHIRERLLFSHYQFATNLHIYTFRDSYVMVDDDAAGISTNHL